MSDFNNPNNFDKYGNPTPTTNSPFEPESTGRAPYVLLGLLVLVGIIGGALYFNGTPNSSRRADVANAPPAASDTMRTPTSPAMPPAARKLDATPTTPAPSTTPAPGGAPTDTVKQ
jgi:hypothetical protein